jgi:hypothetical protein
VEGNEMKTRLSFAFAILFLSLNAMAEPPKPKVLDFIQDEKVLSQKAE